MRELSISLFKDVMKAAAARNQKKMKKQVQRILLPLFLHMNDQMESVAKVQRAATSVVGKGMRTPRRRPGRKGQGLLDGRQSLGMCVTWGSPGWGAKHPAGGCRWDTLLALSCPGVSGTPSLAAYSRGPTPPLPFSLPPSL